MAQFPCPHDEWNASSANTYLHINWPCMVPFCSWVATVCLLDSFPFRIIKPVLSHECIHISPLFTVTQLALLRENQVTWAQPLDCKCLRLSSLHLQLQGNTEIWDPAPQWLCWQPNKGGCRRGCLKKKSFLFSYQLVLCLTLNDFLLIV